MDPLIIALIVAVFTLIVLFSGIPIAIFAFKSFKNIKSSKIFLDPNLILAQSAMAKHKN